MEVPSPFRKNPGGWKQKEGETDEEFHSRIDARRKQAGANLQRGKADRRPRSSEPAVTKKALTTTVGLVNGVVAMFSPIDALGKIQIGEVIDEQEMLVDALIETQATSPLFKKYLGRFVGVAGQASLLGAVALIVYVRLDRRGLVPALGGSAPAGSGQPSGPGPAEAPAPDGLDYWQEQEWKRNHPEPVVTEAAG